MRTALCAGLLAASLCSAAPSPVHADPADDRFQDLKALVGIWRPAEHPESPLRIRFSLTAGGTVLIEEWLRDGSPHSLTVYHRDGEALIATHYCPQGNQPRLALRRDDSDRGVRFDFRDAADLDDGEAHLRTLAFDLSDPASIVRSESYRTGDADDSSVVRLVRAD